jgi:hypothetical protein
MRCEDCEVCNGGLFVRGPSRVVNLLPQVKIEAQLGPGVRRDSRTCDLSRAWPLPATPLT